MFRDEENGGSGGFALIIIAIVLVVFGYVLGSSWKNKFLLTKEFAHVLYCIYACCLVLSFIASSYFLV